jgi:Trk K+ transport system NAD-binding subunit
MKIVIAGAGNVGTHLAKLLSGENQDIILIDDDSEKINRLDSNFDLLTIDASPTSFVALREAGVEKADLFVAVTPDESTNLVACQLANALGAKKTVARIDNYEYMLQRNRDFFTKMGIDSLIYPELLAAKDIVDGMKLSWIRQWWEFAGGALVLMGIKLRENAQILNTPFYMLGSNLPYHIVAILRDGHTIIPGGKDVILAGDLVYFMTMKKHIPYIKKIAGKEELPDVRNVIIMGGSRIAVRASQLMPDYMNLKIIESDIAKYSPERNGKDLVTYLCELVNLHTSDCCLVQTNNSYRTFKKIQELCSDWEIVIVNFNVSLDELINFRTSSVRNTKTLKKTDRLQWYLGIFKNSLEQIRADKTWRVIEYYPEPNHNPFEGFIE